MNQEKKDFAPFEYQLWVIPVYSDSKEFEQVRNGEWMTFESLLYSMLDPFAGDEKDGITFKIIRRRKNE